ncbi:MAG: PAS domain S-box protein, partial [Desulfobacterales bacterium]
MHSEREIEYLLKGIEAFKKRMIVISPDFEILATNCRSGTDEDADIVGKLCHRVFYDRPQPCENCAAQKSSQTGRPSLQTKSEDSANLEKMPCFYAYPIYTGDKIEAFVSMDFDLPTRGQIEDKLQSSNSLLRNLILSAVDGVIAADKKGKILIFNEMAAEIFGYNIEEALESLNIRDIYPDRLELEVMKKLRSEQYGGPGKLRSYETDVLNKDGERIPINLNAAIVYEDDREIAT